MKINEKSSEKQRYESNVQTVKCLLGGISEISKTRSDFIEKLASETDEAFISRFNNVRFDNFVERSFSKVSGDLFKASIEWDEEVIKKIPNLEAALSNMDGNGMGINNFVSNLISSTLVNGVTPCLVDYDTNEDVENTQANANSTTPVFKLIDQENLVNYSQNNNGDLTHFVIESTNSITPTVDGSFEITKGYEKNFLLYIIDRDLKQITVQKYSEDLVENDEGGKDSSLKQVGEDLVLKGFDKLPMNLLSFNTGQQKDPFLLPPPLLAVAHGNRALFQNQAYQSTILKISRFPIFVSTGVEAAPSLLDPFVWLHSDNDNAKFYTLETGGAGINAGKEDIEIAKQSLESSISDFYKAGQGMEQQKTATEAQINKDNELNKIEKYAKNIEDFLNKSFNTAYSWANPNKERLDFGFKINLNTNAFISAGNQSNLLELNKIGVLSRESTLDQFAKQGVLDPSFDITKEAEKINAESDKDLIDYKNPENIPFEG